MLTLEPSSSLVSAIGDDILTILLDSDAIFCAMSSSLSSFSKLLYELC